MGLLSDFFAATPDELAAVSIEWGPGGPPATPAPRPKRGFLGFGGKPASPAPVDAPLPAPRLPFVQSNGITSVELGTLDQLVTGTPVAELKAHGLHDVVRSNDGQGPWVFRLRRELRDGLVGLTDPQRVDAAVRWANTEEMQLSRAHAETLDDLIGRLQALARDAAASDRDLYLWVSL